jgi:hypothetical protein
MRPLAAPEEEREFSVGQRQYILRRLDGGGFDVDITLPMMGGGVAAVPPKRTKSRFGVGPAVFGLLVVLAVGAAFKGIRVLLRSIADPIEITSFTCTPAGRAEFEAVVMLKNLSSDPLDLTGHITLIGLGGMKTPFDARVDPAPLPPDATGRLYMREYLPAAFSFGPGECRLDLFTDASGTRLGYREPR